MILPLVNSEQGIVFFNPRVSLAEEGQGDFSLGLGLRRMILPGLVLGGNLYTDVIETRHDNRLSRWGLGVELLSDFVDFRANMYDVPSGPKMIGEYAELTRTVSSRTTASTRVTGRDATPRPGTERLGYSGSDPVTIEQTGSGETLLTAGSGQFQFSHLFDTTTHYATTYTTRTTTTSITDWFERFEGAGDGWDAELGFRIPWPGGPEFRVFGGWYSFEDPFGPDVEGWKARAEFRPGPWLALEGGLYEDDRLTGSDWFVGARVEIPLSRDLTWADVREGLFGGRARTVAERMRGESPGRDAMRARESGWIENPARQQVERKTEESRQTVHHSSTGSERRVTSETSQLTMTNPDPTKQPIGTLATVSDGGSAPMVLANADGTQQTVTVTVDTSTVVADETSITGALGAPGTPDTVFVMKSDGGGPNGEYQETVTIKSGQMLTSELKVDGTTSTLRSVAVPLIATAASGDTITYTPAAVVTMQSGSTLHRVNVTNETTVGYGTGINVKPDPSGGRGDTLISASEVKTASPTGYPNSNHGVYVDGSSGDIGDLRVTGSEINFKNSHSTGLYTVIGAGRTLGKIDLDNVKIEGWESGVRTNVSGTLGALNISGGSVIKAAGNVVYTWINGGTMTDNLTISDSMIDAWYSNYAGSGVYTSVDSGGKMQGDLTISGSTITSAKFHGVETIISGDMTGNLTISDGTKIVSVGDGVQTHVALSGKMYGSLEISGGSEITAREGTGVYTSIQAVTPTNRGLMTGSLTISDSTITGMGTTSKHHGVYTTIEGDMTGNLKISDSTIRGEGKNSHGVYTEVAHDSGTGGGDMKGTLTISGSTITGYINGVLVVVGSSTASSSNGEMTGDMTITDAEKITVVPGSSDDPVQRECYGTCGQAWVNGVDKGNDSFEYP